MSLTRFKIQSYHCPDCPKVYPAHALLKAHLEVCNPLNFQCKICGSKFMQKSGLISHLKAHAVENSFYGCKQCYKLFKTKLNLKIHTLHFHPENENASQKAIEPDLPLGTSWPYTVEKEVNVFQCVYPQETVPIDVNEKPKESKESKKAPKPKKMVAKFTFPVPNLEKKDGFPDIADYF